MFPFLFNQSHSKVGVANQMIHSCFRKKSAIGQLNVQRLKKGKQYTSSNVIHIKF